MFDTSFWAEKSPLITAKVGVAQEINSSRVKDAWQKGTFYDFCFINEKRHLQTAFGQI